jgi:hypothetical protein
LIDSPEAAARALGDYFLANADRGDNAVNDDLVAEMVRRIRIRQVTVTPDAHRADPGVNPAASATPMAKTDMTLQLSVRTMAWLAKHGSAQPDLAVRGLEAGSLRAARPVRGGTHHQEQL